MAMSFPVFLIFAHHFDHGCSIVGQNNSSSCVSAHGLCHRYHDFGIKHPVVRFSPASFTKRLKKKQKLASSDISQKSIKIAYQITDENVNRIITQRNICNVPSDEIRRYRYLFPIV